MTRATSEWIGRTPDSKAPPRVRARCYTRENGICYLCGGVIPAAKGFDLDHKKALINGGQNRESNLFPVHKQCHRKKTDEDVAEKAYTARVRNRHIGASQPKGQIKSAGFAKGNTRPALWLAVQEEMER